jgi:hypothetical protein
MDKNCIEGAAEQGERAINREALVIKARRRKCSGCAMKKERALPDVSEILCAEVG